MNPEKHVVYRHVQSGKTFWQVTAEHHSAAFGVVKASSSRIYDEYSTTHAAIPMLKKEAFFALESKFKTFQKYINAILSE